MPNHNTLSESEEMYLVTIRQICEDCTDRPIPIPEIAQELEVKPVSVNQMVKKLAEEGLVKYLPYKGVELTPEGRKISTRILRHRRLWEVFLVKSLKMDLEEADELACQFEHSTTSDLANRLANFLDNPSVCFHGLPIYSSEEPVDTVSGIALSHVNVGQPFHTVRVDAEEDLRIFLADQGVSPGNPGSVLAENAFGTIILETAPGNRVTITKDIAERVIVEEHHA